MIPKRFKEIPIRLLSKCPDNDNKFNLCAVSYSGTSVVSYAFNARVTEAAVEQYAKCIHCMYDGKENDWFSYNRHAEVSVIKKSQGIITTVSVVRLTKNGDLALAKPCNVCVAYLRDNGVSQIVYSVNNNSFKKIKL